MGHLKTGISQSSIPKRSWEKNISVGSAYGALQIIYPYLYYSICKDMWSKSSVTHWYAFSKHSFKRKWRSKKPSCVESQWGKFVQIHSISGIFLQLWPDWKVKQDTCKVNLCQVLGFKKKLPFVKDSEWASGRNILQEVGSRTSYDSISFNS